MVTTRTLENLVQSATRLMVDITTESMQMGARLVLYVTHGQFVQLSRAVQNAGDGWLTTYKDGRYGISHIGSWFEIAWDSGAEIV